MPPKTVPAAKLTKELISKDSQAIISQMQEEFIRMKQEMVDEFSVLLGAKLKEVEELKTQVKNLTDKVSKLEDLVDDADQYERRDCLVLSGPALPTSTTGENCTAIVQDVLRTTCNINIATTDISTAHRLGKRPLTQQVDKRSIIVKLCRRDVKEDVFRSSKTQQRPSQLFVNESLSPTRRRIFQTLRSMRRNHPDLVAGCSTFDGKIYAYTKVSDSSSGQVHRDRRHFIRNFDALRKFCEEFVRKPIEAFLTSLDN